MLNVLAAGAAALAVAWLLFDSLPVLIILSVGAIVAGAVVIGREMGGR